MDNNKKIALNSIIIFIRLIITSILALLTSRIVLDALGASDFGLYNVVGGIVIMLNVINTAMISTTYRYVAIELGKGERGELNKVFNACFLIHCLFALVIIFLGGTLGVWYVNHGLNIELTKLSDAKQLFGISIFTTVVSILFVPYNGLLVAYEKFNVQALIDIVVAILKFILLVVLIKSVTNRLVFYGIINSIFSIINYTAAFFYCYKSYRSIVSFKINKDVALYKEMLRFAGWILFGACSSVGKTQGSVMIINYFFGTIVNGAYAVAHQIENFIYMFAQSLNKAAVPQIMKSFSGGDTTRSVRLTSYISKYTFILMAMVSFPVLLETDFLLGVWLKEVPEGTTTFCRLMILSILLGSLGEGIPALIQASNKQKLFQITGSTLTLMGLPLSCIFFYLGAPAQTILVVYCILLTIYSVIRLFILKKVMDFNIKEFVMTSYLKIFLISMPLVLAFSIYNPETYSLYGHIAGLVISEIYLIITIAILGIDSRERCVIKKKILKR